MEKYNDFRQKLLDLKDRRVRLSFVIDGTERIYESYGWIRNVNEYTLELEDDPSTGNTHIKTSWFNLSSIIIYGIDEVDEEADLSDKPETAEYVGERTEYIPYDKEGKPIREPQAGYVILHKDHIYAKGTVYTLLRETEGEPQQSKETVIK